MTGNGCEVGDETETEKGELDVQEIFFYEKNVISMFDEETLLLVCVRRGS